MKPDISNPEHFYTFIGKSKINAKEAARSLETSRTVRDNTYAYLTEKKEYIKNTFNIDLDKYESEWVNKVYNKSEDLYNIAKKLLEKYESGEERIVLLQIVKYCVVLKKCYNSRIAFELYTKQKNINYKQYLNYLRDYYYTVHKCVLQGYAYNYAHGTGDLIVSIFKNVNPKTVVDWMATKRNKEKLIKEGVKVYNELEAAWYSARGIKYDGVDYRIFKNLTSIHKITFINSKIIVNKEIDFECTMYAKRDIKHYSEQELASMCDTRDNVYYLPLSLNKKINVLLYRFPEDYVKFIRNESQHEYELGAHNSKNRKRFQS